MEIDLTHSSVATFAPWTPAFAGVIGLGFAFGGGAVVSALNDA